MTADFLVLDSVSMGIFDERLTAIGRQRLLALYAETDSIHLIRGVCPVQIEGRVDGHAFYFRARQFVTVEIATSPEFNHALDDASPDCVKLEFRGYYPGWMEYDEALVLLAIAIGRWRDGQAK